MQRASLNFVFFTQISICLHHYILVIATPSEVSLKCMALRYVVFIISLGMPKGTVHIKKWKKKVKL